MASKYLSKLNEEQRMELTRKLLDSQRGKCFICEKEIDLQVHQNAIDVDHIEPLKNNGKDDPSNFALTHSSCNRSKQASDLRVARVIARLDKIIDDCELTSNRGPNLSDVFQRYGGAKYEISIKKDSNKVKYTLSELGNNQIYESPIYEDSLSGCAYFFAKLPIEYLFHDDKINPRTIGGSVNALIEEFFKKRPQLHASLGWTTINDENNKSRICVFDGQHKAAAQVLLGVKELPIRVFVNPDLDLLLTTNTNAGTKLKQIAFDKSVQRHLGSELYYDRVQRYQKDHSLEPDAFGFSEKDLITHFKGESREMKKYILDAARDSITYHDENKLRDFTDIGGGRSTEKPISYSSVEKTFYSFFIYQGLLETSLDYMLGEDRNPREIEKKQIVKLMNIIADEIYIGRYDPGVTTSRIEKKIRDGEIIPEDHLIACRLSREEIMYVWLEYIRKIIYNYFIMLGTPCSEEKLFQHEFPEPLWDRIKTFVINLRKMPVWINKELSLSVFGGKQTYEYWETIFETGKSPQNQQVLTAPINLMDMIKES